MEPPPSQEEQEQEEAPQQDVASTVDERKKKVIEEATSAMESYRVRCSEMLEDAAARGRPAMGDDLELRGLEFLEQELSYIVLCFTAASPQHADLGEMMPMLQYWTRMVSHILSRVLSEADHPQRRTLLRRAVQCLRRRRRHRDPVWILSEVERLNSFAEHCSRLLVLPPQAEEGGVDRFEPSSRDFASDTSASATLNLLAATPAPDHGNQASMIPRRLALHHDDPSIPSLLQKFDLSKTRSLAVSGAVNGVPLDKFVNLVVLDVEGWENFGDDDLLKVCSSKMFFLHYLSIRNTRVTKLPPEMKELHNLRVLDASYTQITELPLQVFVATYLSRLDLRGTAIRQLTLPKQIPQMEGSLHALLVGGEGVINSAETATIVPPDIGRFWNLQILATIDLSDQPASLLKALGDLENLMVLAITWSFYQSSDTDSCEALLSSIKKWKRLDSLAIHCGFGCSMEFLGSLSDMSSDLQTFKVTLGRFASVPQWFHGLIYLSFIQITVCKLEARDLEILRGLPALKCLILGLDFIPSEAIVIKNEGFLELQKFSIDCPVSWVTFESGALPKLTYLQLNFRACPTSLISVPLGISNLRGLTEIALWYNVRYANSSSVKMTVEAVKKEVSQCRSATKKIGLFINGIEQDDVQAVVEDTQKCPNGTNAGAVNDVQAVDEGTTAAVQSEITEAES